MPDTTVTLSRDPASTREEAKALRTFAVIGNPNAGKTTLFNALTGLRQKTGNYPGVTVERKEGICYSQHGKPIRLIDLPGSYSLSARSPDEAVMLDVLLGRRPDTPAPDAILCITDASNVERNLFLASQALELGLPVIVVLNMSDLARDAGIEIDADALAERLGATVVATEAHRKTGLTELRVAMSKHDLPTPPPRTSLVPLFDEARLALQEALEDEGCSRARARGESFLLLAGGNETHCPGSRLPEEHVLDLARHWEYRLDAEAPGWREKLVADRYDGLSMILAECTRRDAAPQGPTLTDKVDRIVLHPVYGWFILFGVLGSLFYSIFKVAPYAMDLIDSGVGVIAEGASTVLPEGILGSLLVDGVIAGVGGVIIFLPQIMMLFFLIGLLESTGYMARAAFLLDRVMNRFGLHGKAFVPLLSSYACAIPGIMATRTIENPRDRLATILIAPWMSCSARLPVYFVLIAALAGGSIGALAQAGILLAIYVLGTLTALIVAWLFKSSLLKGRPQPLVLELPPYRLPSLKSVLIELYERGRAFLVKAGTIILAISIVIWAATTFPKAPEGTSPGEAIEYSAAGQLGKVIEPVIEPLGYDWKIGIGVLTSFAAREVFVSTMAIIYSVGEGAEEPGATEVEPEEAVGPYPAGAEEAVAAELAADAQRNTTADQTDEETSLVSTLLNQKHADGGPVYTPLVCISLLVLYIYALQCLPTSAVVRRETNSWKWPIFQLGFMTATAWLMAFVVYQGGRLLGFS